MLSLKIRLLFTRVFCVAALLGISMGLSGCESSGPTRIPLSGKVTRGGQPIKQGSLVLTPAAGQKGVAANTAITDGQYQFSREDGPGPGAYRAIIQEVATKEEILKRQSIGGIAKSQWERDLKVPESGSPKEDFAVE